MKALCLFKRNSSGVGATWLEEILLASLLVSGLWLVAPDGAFWTIQAVAFLWLGVLGAIQAGSLVIDRIELPASSRTLASLVFGIAIISHIALILCVLLPVTSREVWIACAIVAVAVSALTRRGRQVAPMNGGLLVLFTVVVINAAIWGHYAAASMRTLAESGKLPLWVDYYIHAVEIAQFADTPGLGRGDMALVDFPPVFYHYASYIPAAAIMDALRLSPMGAATSAWVYLSFISLYAGIALLAMEWSGISAAILSVAALAALPDASHLGLQNDFFSFHWLNIVSVGGGYAIGTGGLSLTLLCLWIRHRQRAALVAGFLALVLTFEFRVHVFLLVAPVWAGAFLLAFGHRGARILGQLGVAAVAAILVVAMVPGGIAGWPVNSRALSFVKLVNGFEPTVYAGIYRAISPIAPAVAFVTGILLILLAAFGLLLPLEIARVVLRSGKDRRAGNWIPLLAVATFFTAVVIAPTPSHGDITELKQRGFVFVYAVLMTSIVAGATAWLKGRDAIRRGIAGFAALASFPTLLTSADTLASFRLSWGAGFIGSRLDPALLAIANHVRAASAPGDVIALDEVPQDGINARLVDDATIVTALSGTPAYLARYGVQVIHSDERRAVAEARLQFLQSLRRTSDKNIAGGMLEGARITFYLCSDSRTAAWDPAGTKAVFRAGSYTLYRSRR